MNAVSSIDKLNATKRLQQTLGENPNDIHALLELAALLGTFKDPDLDKKRKVLNRVLTLDPVNKTAREMLLEMDRAGMGGDPSQAAPSSISTVQHPVPASTGSSNDPLEKSLVFRYSINHQVLVYALIAFSIFVGVNIIESIDVLLVFGAFLLFLLIPLWFVSAIVEVSSERIKVSRLFGLARREIAWGDIEKIEPNALGQGIKLITSEGKLLVISSQLHGYPVLVEILLRKRPDVFQMAPTPNVSNAAQNGSGESYAATRIFRKGFLAKYGLFFFLIPATPLALGAVFAPPFLPGILVAVLVFYFWRSTLHAVHLLKLEENRLSTQSFRKHQELMAQQINNISMISVRNRRGVAKTFIQIETMNGGAFRLSGFPQGNEIMYGLLMNWWSTYQTK